jgi:ribosome-associated toxin RatA of RatAB toxin-antitoxin module
MADATESSIVIEASASEIMDVIADLPLYPEWSEGVKSIEVLTEFDDGRPETARFTFDAGVIKDVYDLLYEWDGDREVSWKLTKGKVLKTMDGTYSLEEVDGETTVNYVLAVGLNIPMLGVMKRQAEKAIVDTALKGLKKRVEG